MKDKYNHLFVLTIDKIFYLIKEQFNRTTTESCMILREKQIIHCFFYVFVESGLISYVEIIYHYIDNSFEIKTNHLILQTEIENEIYQTLKDNLKIFRIMYILNYNNKDEQIPESDHNFATK